MFIIYTRMLKLKHIRFTVKKNKFKQTNTKKRKMFVLPIKHNYFTMKNKNKMFKSINFFGPKNGINQLNPKLLIKPNVSIYDEQRQRFKQYLKRTNIERKHMIPFLNKTKNEQHKTPIYNRYVSGSGIGASNITTRRLKKRYA